MSSFFDQARKRAPGDGGGFPREGPGRASRAALGTDAQPGTQGPWEGPVAPVRPSMLSWCGRQLPRRLLTERHFPDGADAVPSLPQAPHCRALSQSSWVMRWLSATPRNWKPGPAWHGSRLSREEVTAVGLRRAEELYDERMVRKSRAGQGHRTPVKCRGMQGRSRASGVVTTRSSRVWAMRNARPTIAQMQARPWRVAGSCVP